MEKVNGVGEKSWGKRKKTKEGGKGRKKDMRGTCMG